MEVYFLAILFLLVSSFIKCLVDSQLDKSFLTRRSECDTCHKELGFFELIPIYSYIRQGARCRSCHNRIPRSVFLYEVAGLLVGLAYLFLHNNLVFITYIDYWIVLILLFIAIEDYYTYEINPKLQFILFGLVIVNLIIEWEDLSLISTFSMIVIFNLIYYLTRGGIGYGDIKLFSILSFSLSFIDNVYLFLYTFILAGFYAIYLLIKGYRKNTKVALALYIALAYIFILLRGEFLW